MNSYLFVKNTCGIAMFGVVGIIIGPIPAALFVAVWHLGTFYPRWDGEKIPHQEAHPMGNNA